MTSWNKFYLEERKLRDYLGSTFAHCELFEEIIKEKPDSILDVGVGTGITSIFLSHLGYNVTAIDNSEKILNSAKDLCGKLNGKVNYRVCNAFNLDKIFKAGDFDVICSQGFFEHFNNEQICNLLNQQLKIAKTIFISVPSKYYIKKDFGNERLMGIKDWHEILTPFALNIDFIKYYGFHLPPRKSLSSFILNPAFIFKFILGTVLKERSQILIKLKSGLK